MKKNIVVAFCGMDGTGKTTISKKVALNLKKRGYKIKFIHGHTYSLSKNSLKVDEKIINNYRFLFRFLIPLAYIDNIISYFKQYRKKTISIVSDRYFYDKVVRLIYYKICPIWLARIYLKLLPKPDKVFFLDIEPKRALMRKKEYRLEEFRLFRKYYLLAAQTLSAPVINTRLSIKECVSEIMNYFKH